MALSDKIKTFIGDDPNEKQITSSITTKASKNSSGTKMILLEPRAFSEAQTIADYLKKGDTVVVNLKRVTPEVAKRIVDFLSGAVYAIEGELQKLGHSIFLCTPSTVNVEGKISDADKTAKKEKTDDSQFDW